jgi:orotate phosphoribosyltransferase
MDPLIQLFHARGAVRRGDFVLKSGKRSDLYVDVKKLSLCQDWSARALRKLPYLAHLHESLFGFHRPHLAGKAEGVNNLLGGPSVPRTANEDPPLHSLLLRPQAKAHGVDPGSSILTSANLSERHTWVVIEDVTTTGHSALEVVRSSPLPQSGRSGRGRRGRSSGRG